MFKFFSGKGNIEQKAQPTTNSFMDFLKGDSDRISYTSKDLLMYNRGWVASCLNKNSATIASVPIKLFYKSKGKVLKATQNHSLTQKQFKSILKSTSVKDIKAIEDVVEIEDHTILDLLCKPNKRMNYPDLISVTESYLGLIGNAYWLKVRDNKGKVIEIIPLKAEYISANVEDNGLYSEIKSYKYTHDNKEVIIKLEDIIHFANYTAGCMVYGKGELEQCLSAAERELYYDQYESYLNKNNARPDYGMFFKNGIKENERKDIATSIKKYFGGAKNSGKPIVLSGDVEVKQLGFAPKDMAYANGRMEIRKEICSVFGVPEALIVINDSNFASAKSATQHYYEFTIQPKLVQLLEKINEQLVSEFDPDLFVWFDSNFEASVDPLEQSTIDATYLDKGVYDVAYVQDRMGITVEAEVNDNQVSQDQAGVE
jgi:HK97 family phage portal protein